MYYDYVTSDLYNYILAFVYNYYILVITIGIIKSIALWKLFKKAGFPGWASLIPIYNLVVIFKIAKVSPWYILLYFVPIVDIIVIIVFTILIRFKIAYNFSKSTAFGFGLLFLSFIFLPILAFSNAKYKYAKTENI